MLKPKHVLWSDPYFWTPHEIYEWKKDFAKANEIEKVSDEMMLDALGDELDILRDELKNIDTNTIIAIADIGRWNGRCCGYKEFKSLDEIFFSDCDYCKWYTDRFNLRGEGIHHDGCNYLLYRERKAGITDEQWDTFHAKILDGPIMSTHIQKYTTSLVPTLEKYFGWKG